MSHVETIQAALQHAKAHAEYRSEWHQYKEALAALEQIAEDSARLDWLFADVVGRKVYVRDYDEDTGAYTFICCGSRAETPRAAVDAARHSGGAPTA